MISRILTLVESLPASFIAEQWQTHPWAAGLQEENEAIQRLFACVPLQQLQAGMFVLLLTLLCIGDVQALTFDGWLLLDELANGSSYVAHEDDLCDSWKTPLTLHYNPDGFHSLNYLTT